ncbi:MAG: hypothetical protein WDN69_12640 [Aliidongia sp.]
MKGFSEALIGDLRLNAPHVKVSVVMPGHIGTSIALNTMKAQGFGETDADLPEEMRQMGEDFRSRGLSPDQAAGIILDGVRQESWRILVGPDAIFLDQAVRAAPEKAYEADFLPPWATR